MSKAISRALLGKIVDEVFGGGIEDSRVIEEIYSVIKREEAALSAAEAFAAMTTDYLGCEYLSRDVANIENIAASGSEGPTEVIYFYTAPPVPSVAVVSLIWEPHGSGWRGCGPLIYSVFPAQYGGGWWAALEMAGYLPFRERCESPDAAKAASQTDFEVRIHDAICKQAQEAAEPSLSVKLDRKLGIYGRAYDGPDTFRAYTYNHQPANIEAWRLGRSCAEIQPGGDYIDRGLHLLDALQRAGFGVFEIGTAPVKTEGCK
ncbi:hypothetical protein AGR8A_Cc60460 [Agrobacterium fabrum str. J-07]|uniref:hypothetical protein n=1 Tax=Agrobacterium fabrum TaxID=1176649 RepID=UPI0009BA31E8|nr:hypothetical protein [Agrobacterium fabrum]CUX27035.1 hypothetical protein AGR8A_Cc60460 [Agrobacterium fabrum str. J-07]